MKILRMAKNRDESEETQSEYYDHEAIRFRGQKSKSKFAQFTHCIVL